MRTQSFGRSTASFLCGVGLALLFAACSSVMEAPETSGTGASAGVQPPPSTIAGQLPLPPAGVPVLPATEPFGAAGGSGGGQGSQQGQQGVQNGNDTIVVSGTRIRRDDFTSPNATISVTAEDMRNLGTISAAEMVNQLPSNVADVSPATNTDAGFNSSSIENLRGMNAGGASAAADPAATPPTADELAASMAELIELIREGRSADTQDSEQRLAEFRQEQERSRSAVEGAAERESQSRAAEQSQGVDRERILAEQAARQQQAQQARTLTLVDSRRIVRDGANTASPLTRIAPGEELWIISQPAPDQPLQAAIPEDALGPGVMIARFTPAVFDNEPQALREIPLPLKHTEVEARIEGYVGTVDVTQQFENPYDQKIEAVYLFPLPEKAAVSEFVMTIGERRIRGILREKAQAEQIYREARAQGYQASLLTQHRPNVFEQRVANIEPGRQIDVNIRYYETLAYADGWYSFVFPTVVGPRYNPPGSADPLLALPATSFEPTPAAAVRYLTPGTTSAHDISIAVELDAGVAIEEIDSSHAIETRELPDGVVAVTLRDGATLPNADFRLNFRVAGDTIKSNLLTYVDDATGAGYFTLMLYPPADLGQLRRQPLELVFVLDCSGSMSGQPLQQAKAAIIAALDRLEPTDSFQIIRFSQNASQFGPAPVAATPENLRAARDYVYGLTGSGGTQMIEGIRAALGFPHDEERLRFVTFLTDGYIGNETEILAAIERGLGPSRIFSFGVGSSPNRYLLERMAGIGRGAVAYLSLQDSGRVVMDAFFDRIAHPAMIDVEIDYGSMAVRDVYPRRLPDLFVGRPVVVTGRFEGRAGDVELRGRAAGEPVAVTLPRERSTPEHDFLPNLWARLKIADLNDELAVDPARGQLLAAEIRQTALDYELMSDYTAFIAVDASRQTEGTTGTTVYQAVPVPEGVRYETTVAER